MIGGIISPVHDSYGKPVSNYVPGSGSNRVHVIGLQSADYNQNGNGEPKRFIDKWSGFNVILGIVSPCITNKGNQMMLLSFPLDYATHDIWKVSSPTMSMSELPSIFSNIKVLNVVLVSQSSIFITE